MSGRVDPSIAQCDHNRNADSNGKGPAQQYEVTQPDDRLGPLRKDSQESNSDQESVYHSIYDESSSTLSRSVVVTEHASTSARLISTTGTNTVTQVTEGMNRLEVVEHNRTMVNTVQINERSVVQSRPAAEPSMFSGAIGTTISGGTHNVISNGGHANEDKRQNVFERGGIFFQHCTFMTSPGETIAELSTVTGQTHHLPNIGHNTNQTRPTQLPVRSAHRKYYHTDGSNSLMNDNRYFQASSEYARVPHQAPQIRQNDDHQLEYIPILDRQSQYQESRERQESEDHEYHDQVEDHQRQADREFQQRRAPTAIPPDEPAPVVRQDLQIQDESLSVLVSPTENIASDSYAPIISSPGTPQSPRSSIITKISSVFSMTLSNMSDSKYQALLRFNRKHLPQLHKSEGHDYIYQLLNTRMPQFEVPNSDVALWKFSRGIPANISGSAPPESFRAIAIGDVGFFNDSGGFDPIFNCLYSMEENLSAHLHPPSHGFRPFLNTNQIYEPSKTPIDPGTVYHSKGLKYDDISADNLGANGASINVTLWHDDNGSAIVIPEEGEFIHLPVLTSKNPRKDILEYVAMNARGWYEHIKGILQGPDAIQNGELLMVTATYTAPYRGLIVFQRDTVTDGKNVNPFLAEFTGTKGSYSWKFRATEGYNYVIGSSPRSQNLRSTSPQAHCFAIRPLSICCTRKDCSDLGLHHVP